MEKEIKPKTETENKKRKDDDFEEKSKVQRPQIKEEIPAPTYKVCC